MVKDNILKTKNPRLLPTIDAEGADENARLQPYKHERLILFLLTFLVDLIFAVLLSYVYYIGNGDAISRTANASYVVFSRKPHLAAIGFVWPPLPSFLQIPLLLILRPLGLARFAGPLLVCLIAACSSVVLDDILIRTNLPAKFRWIFIILICLQPDYFYLSSSGMSEPVLLFFILLDLWAFMQLPGNVRVLVVIGISCACAFFVRYESIVVIAASAAAVAIYDWGTNHNWRNELEGKILTILLPPVYTILFWIFMNWILMGNPLYFYNSDYSLAAATDVAKNAGVQHPYHMAMGNLYESLKVMINRIWIQSPAFLFGFPIGMYLAIRKKNFKYIGMLLIMISMPLLTMLVCFMGTLPAYLRYWFYVVAFGPITVGIIWNLSPRPVFRKFMVTCMIILCLADIPINIRALGNPNLAADEQRLSALLSGNIQQEKNVKNDHFYEKVHDSEIIGPILDEYSLNGLVMIDASKSFMNILAVKHPERLMASNDTDFRKAITAPWHYAKYMLMLDPMATSGYDEFNQAFPFLYQDGAEWAKLVWDSGNSTIEHYRIFELDPNYEMPGVDYDPAAGESPASVNRNETLQPSADSSGAKSEALSSPSAEESSVSFTGTPETDAQVITDIPTEMPAAVTAEPAFTETGVLTDTPAASQVPKPTLIPTQEMKAFYTSN